MALLEERYPAAWAAPEDRAGLQIGDPEAPVHTVLVALEASAAVLAEAREMGAGLLLTHHPLLFRPLGVLREDDPLGRLVAEAVRAGLAVAACHTNLDAAPGGLNDYLAGLLGLVEPAPFAENRREPAYKLTVFVPVGYEEKVRTALMDERVGVIGRYTHCSFAGRGQGTYVPQAGAQPFRGQAGALSRAEEVRLEALAPESALPAALARLRESHPYEDPAVDLYPLHGAGAVLGYGRVGDLPRELEFTDALARVKEAFRVERLRVWGRPPRRVRRVAVLGGSGGDFIAAARRRGAQLLVTGEVRHHQAVPGDWDDFAVLEVGHFASEVIFMPAWADILQDFFQNLGHKVTVAASRRETPPFFFG